MGDSDDEYDRRRARDKFRRERSDYQERREDRNRREDFTESRDRSGRRDYRDYDPRSRRERYSPPRHDLSPPIKRIRRDCNVRRDDRGGYGNYGGYDMNFHPTGGNSVMMGGPPGHWGGGGGAAMVQDMNMIHATHGEPEAGLTQPPMKTFKAFLGMQDDTIDDQEAVKKYNQYKQDFHKNQISEFFINHKEEEWFKNKYHPEESVKKQKEHREALQKRLNVFMDLLGGAWMDNVAIDVDKSEQVIRLLDAAVIKLEGGTDFDLRALDEPIEEEKPKDNPPNIIVITTTEELGSTASVDNCPTELEKNSTKVHNPNTDLKPNDCLLTEGSRNEPVVKKHSDNSDKEDSNNSSESSSDSDDDDDNDEDEDDEQNIKALKRKQKKKLELENKLKLIQESIDHKILDPAVLQKKSENADGNEDKAARIENPENTKTLSEGELQGPLDAVKEETPEEPKPRPLHRTCSIFLRNLAPTITKLEVETFCKRYSGFLRVAIADPQPERRFFRRGWVTFERTANIKDICWNLNNIRLRDCELGAIVNRDLSRRIRSMNGIAAHKQVVRSDIKICARIIQNLDSIKKLWIAIDEMEPDIPGLGMGSKNPLLKNITDFLIEEASAEEEELLGASATEDPENAEAQDTVTNTLERDETLIKVLDRLLLYLRIVHSVDYYNQSEYPNEDEMPNRCGIMHARGSPPTTKVTPQELTDYIQTFEQKISSFLQPHVKLSEEEANKLGRKNAEEEVEKFIQANSQELAKDKWLCPLSGKKFKGPEFIRKHIFNKHGEKVEEVRKEVEYFNNYLQDSKRPQLPEHPQNRQQAQGGPRGDGMMPYPGVGGFMPGGPPFPGGFRGPPPGFMPGGFGGRNNFPDMYNRAGNFNKRGSFGRGRPDPREIIEYHDLDYPQDFE